MRRCALALAVWAALAAPQAQVRFEQTTVRCVSGRGSSSPALMMCGTRRYARKRGRAKPAVASSDGADRRAVVALARGVADAAGSVTLVTAGMEYVAVLVRSAGVRDDRGGTAWCHTSARR